MKKITILGIGIVALGMVACGGSTKPETVEEADTVAVAMDDAEVVAELAKVNGALESGDAEAVENEVKQLQAKVKQLVESGDKEAAAAYSLKLKEWYEQNKAKVDEVAKNGTTIGRLVDAVVKLPGDVAANADAAVEAVKDDAAAVQDAAAQKAEEMKQDAKLKVDEAKENAKKEAEKKVDEAAQKAVEKADEAVGNTLKSAAQKLTHK